MKPRSMEEKISYLLFLMGFAGLVCTAALCIFVFHKAFREQAWTALERETDLVAAGCAQVDAPSQLEAYVDGSLRITLIASDGSVLCESATNQPMENHLSRPEIQQAMKSGVGRDCRDVPEEEWESAIVGYTTILDMTEESILKGNDFVPGNPRYLTIVKNFPTFFSFGPQLVTPDEVPDVLKLEVQSVHNGEIHAKNTVDHMTHVPSRLVSLHSSIQGWYAGDVLSTGTPRAFHIQDGDIAECRIVGPDGFEMEPLKNPVVDLKLH